MSASTTPAPRRTSGRIAGAEDQRAYWLDVLERVSAPVLEAAAARQLGARLLPAMEGAPSRSAYTCLEAVGRLLSGIAPWLELTANGGAREQRLRTRFRRLARETIDAITDPDSPDFGNFARGRQPVVDTAFLAQAMLRAPVQLRERLPRRVRDNLAAAFAASRVNKPSFSNWLLFSATTEAALCALGRDWDRMRVDYALRQHEQWYVGDGLYSDGPEFHFDYYNSFVIQPMLLDVLAAVGEHDDWAKLGLAERTLRRARRYAAIQERLISPEGTVPPVGRSLTYRGGVLQGLAQIALLKQLPPPLSPAQVRCAMTAVIRRLMEAPGTFDEQGWLRIGFCGAQPGLGEGYISTGSLYLCATALLPLGLPAEDEFWSSAPADWTARRIYGGQDSPADKALPAER